MGSGLDQPDCAFSKELRMYLYTQIILKHTRLQVYVYRSDTDTVLCECQESDANLLIYHGKLRQELHYWLTIVPSAMYQSEQI